MNKSDFHPIQEPAAIRNGRRGLFMFLAIALTAFGAWLLQVDDRRSWLDILQWILFVVLLAHISTGFSLALLGFFRQVSGAIDILELSPEKLSPAELPATALLIPVYNEDMGQVAVRLRNMWQSLGRSGGRDAFDIYLLSDSDDPDCWAGEMETWLSLVQELEASGRLFYRRRRRNPGHKSGNIADFCRRWGKHYRYMVVLDADSVLTGSLMVELVQAMEQRPNAGIVQTVPQLVGGESLYRRSMQFASSLYGRIFVQGCAYWQMDAANYWGHNAIIRISAFMDYCALPDLPPSGEEKTHILSHDTIEAALMRKAGYEVWLLPGRTGSYEESPPNLTEALVRDRRWCRGNFQHVWFLFAKGIDFSNRIHIAFGLLAYVSSPLWLLFIILGVASLWVQGSYPFAPDVESPNFLLLFFFTAALLFGPKVLSVLSNVRGSAAYGGGERMIASVLIEVVLSALTAPVMMLFHTLFVFQAMAGKNTRWGTQNRTDADLSWASCFRTYGWVSLLGIVSSSTLLMFLPSPLLWLSPIWVSWILAVPLARWTSLKSLGLSTKEMGLFLIPEEVSPPPELSASSEKEEQGKSGAPAGAERLLLNPLLLALHLSFLRQQEKNAEKADPSDPVLSHRCLEKGITALSKDEKKALLNDSDAVLALHESLWVTPGNKLGSDWRKSFSRA